MQTIRNCEKRFLQKVPIPCLQGTLWLSCLCAAGICCSAATASATANASSTKAAQPCCALQERLLYIALWALYTTIVWCWSRSDCICRLNEQVNAQGSLPVEAYMPATSCIYLLGLCLLLACTFLACTFLACTFLCAICVVIRTICVAEMPPWCIETLCLVWGALIVSITIATRIASTLPLTGASANQNDLSFTTVYLSSTLYHTEV